MKDYFDDIKSDLEHLNDTKKNECLEKEAREKELRETLLEMNRTTKEAIDDIKTDLEDKIEAFTFDFDNYPRTMLKSAFTTQKEIFTNDISDNKKSFDLLISNEPEIIEEKFDCVDEENSQLDCSYKKISHPSYYDYKKKKGTIAIGNKINITFADSLSFSSGDHISANLKIKGNRDYTNISMRKGDSQSYTNVDTIKSTHENTSYDYRHGNVDSSYYCSDRTTYKKILTMDYSHEKAHSYDSFNLFGARFSTSHIIFSEGGLHDTNTFSFGIGGPFTYITPYQTSFWTYFSIIRFINVGFTAKANSTSVLDFKVYTRKQKDQLITTEFLANKLDQSMIAKYNSQLTSTIATIRAQNCEEVKIIKSLIFTENKGSTVLIGDAKSVVLFSDDWFDDPEAVGAFLTSLGKIVKTFLNIFAGVLPLAVLSILPIMLSRLVGKLQDDRVPEESSTNDNEVSIVSGYTPINDAVDVDNKS
jgi:hypothetical protein